MVSTAEMRNESEKVEMEDMRCWRKAWKKNTKKMREGMRKDVHVTAGMNEREDGESEGRRGPRRRGKVHVTGREGWGGGGEERRMSAREQ